MSGVLVASSMRSVTPRISAGPMPVSAAPVAAATSTTVDRPPGIVSARAITERRANAKPTAKRAPMVVKNTPTEMFWVSDSTLYSELAESVLLESPSKLPFPKKMHAAKSTPALAPNRRMSDLRSRGSLPVTASGDLVCCSAVACQELPSLALCPGRQGNRPEAPGNSALVGRRRVWLSQWVDATDTNAAVDSSDRRRYRCRGGGGVARDCGDLGGGGA